MQARKNKYQRDKRGYIIEDKTGKDVDKGKGKTKIEEVATKNKFSALEVEEVMNPSLQIIEGKGEDRNNGKKKEQGEKQSKKVQEKGSEGKNGKVIPNPNVSGKGATGKSIPSGEGNQGELKRVKKEAVDKVLQNSANPTPSRIHSSGDQEVAKIDSSIPKDQKLEERVNKESTIEWVHRRFGTSKEELRQLNVTTNQSRQDIPSQTYGDSGQLDDLNEVNSAKPLWSDEVEVMYEQLRLAKARVDKEKEDKNQMQKTGNTVAVTVNRSSPKTRVDCSLSFMELQSGKSIGGGSGASKEAGNQDGSVAASLSIEKVNGTVTSRKTGEILAFVDGIPVYAMEKGHDEGVPIDVMKDTVCSDLSNRPREGGDLNGTVTQAVSASCATVNPKLSSVYGLQFKMMQEKLGDMVSDADQLKAALTPYDPGAQAIVSKESEVLPMACSSGTGSPLQIKVNVPLKSPNQVLHDLSTHQELPLEIQNSLVEQQKEFEEEGDDESTAENFKGVMREGDVSPTAANRSGKKGKKNQSKEPLQPTRILPRRAASTASR
ncbi:hypothetical protein A4A49_05511 [Nicotiana attenuata]|uniref:Uncharacterized protein n=1 Tax=Nicotiana attenuata TaxID=49451 RepID=A0A1J6I7Y3_NICAT|nr:hypothetical protein A4A49_05511 [Nicotiana attenuata]